MKIFTTITRVVLIGIVFLTSRFVFSQTPSPKLEITDDSYWLRLHGSQYVPGKTPLDIMNLGLQGPTGAMNLTFRVGFPYTTGVGGGTRLDLLKLINGNTILGTDETGDGLGNIGIGATSPTAKLEIVSNSTLLRLRGTQFSSNTPFDIVNLGFQGPTGAMNLAFRTGFPYTNGVGSGLKLDLIKLSNGNTILCTNEQGANLGNVGIGTTNLGSFKLAVEGKIGAREVNVTATNPFPDYVFESTYNLRPLSQVESFIKENKHLPEIPSAKEVEANGINLGEMDALLLKKIEELTLYMIEMKKEIATLKEENRQLKTK